MSERRRRKERGSRALMMSAIGERFAIAPGPLSDAPASFPSPGRSISLSADVGF